MTAIGIIALIPALSSLNFASYEGLIEGIVLTIATYSYVYNKKIFPTIAWKCIFVYLLILWALQILVKIVPIDFLSFIETNIYNGLGPIIFSIVLSIPAIIAMYRLGKRT